MCIFVLQCTFIHGLAKTHEAMHEFITTTITALYGTLLQCAFIHGLAKTHEAMHECITTTITALYGTLLLELKMRVVLQTMMTRSSGITRSTSASERQGHIAVKFKCALTILFATIEICKINLKKKQYML